MGLYKIENGADLTNILMIFAIADTILGVTWRLKEGRHLNSRIFLGGIVQNIGLSVLPLGLQVLANFTRQDLHLYQTSLYIIGVFIALALSQSIIANALLCGLKLPAKIMTALQNWLSSELQFKKGERIIIEEKNKGN